MVLVVFHHYVAFRVFILTFLYQVIQIANRNIFAPPLGIEFFYWDRQSCLIQMNVIKVVSKSNEANLLLLVPKTNFSMSITLKKLYSLIIHFKVLLVSLKYLDCLNLYLTFSRFCNFLRIAFFILFCLLLKD